MENIYSFVSDELNSSFLKGDVRSFLSCLESLPEENWLQMPDGSRKMKEPKGQAMLYLLMAGKNTLEMVEAAIPFIQKPFLLQGDVGLVEEMPNPWLMAINGDKVEVAHLLYDNGFVVPDEDLFREGMFSAARVGSVDMATWLVKRNVSPLAEKPENGNSVGHFAAASGLVDFTEWWKGQGGNLHAVNHDGEGLLHFAIQRKHGDLALYLASQGVSIHSMAKDDLTPLHLALRLSYIELSCKLLRLQPLDESQLDLTIEMSRKIKLDASFIGHLESLRRSLHMGTSVSPAKSPFSMVL